eukprot:13036717-Heterocapsa_arctica.AAC.1
MPRAPDRVVGRHGGQRAQRLGSVVTVVRCPVSGRIAYAAGTVPPHVLARFRAREQYIFIL